MSRHAGTMDNPCLDEMLEEFFKGSQTSPEKTLLAAIITRAIKDVLGNYPIQRFEAMEWIMEEDYNPFSFTYIVSELFPTCESKVKHRIREIAKRNVKINYYDLDQIKRAMTTTCTMDTQRSKYQKRYAVRERRRFRRRVLKRYKRMKERYKES